MGMIIYKTDEEVELLRHSNLVVSKVLAEVGALLRPGITGVDLDNAAETIIRDHGGIPSFKGYKGFPAALCVSLNEQVVHGIPDKNQIFKEGDVVSVDCGVFLNGFHGDSAYTFAIGDVEEEIVELLSVTNTSLYKGIEQAISGRRIGDIGAAIQEYVERHNGFGIVRELVGHGVGRSLHEAPEVPNFGKRGKGVKLREGMVIAIEPMVNMGHKRVKTARDGWTVFAKDHKPSAHFEHSVVVRKNKADILSDHSLVEKAIMNNPNIKKIGLKMALA